MRWYVKPHVALSHYLIIGAAIVALCNSAENGSVDLVGTETSPSPSLDIVQIDLYYESLCYDSIQFIKYQLQPVYRSLKNYLDIRFIPYGKASHVKSRDRNGQEKWHFTCQHGSSECYGNKAQACGINDILTDPERADKQQDQVNFVVCVMSARNPSTAVPQCLEAIGVNAAHRSLVNECIDSTNGDDLLAAYGDKTLNLQPNIGFVPTIVVNGVFTHQNQHDALNDFKGTVCRHIPDRSKPTICSS